MPADDLLERRVARLGVELLDELGIELSHDALLELAYCRHVEPHEGRRPSYGAVVLDAAYVEGYSGRPPLPSPAGYLDSSASIDVLRTFADGRTSFLVRVAGAEPLLAVDPAFVGNERGLAAYVDAHSAIVVQRLASGRIRVFQGNYVYSEEGGVWLARPTARHYEAAVAAHIPEESLDLARHILDICMHDLSPAGHGATLVWYPTTGPHGSTHLDHTAAIPAPKLSFANPQQAPAIAHALGQRDCATIVDVDGSLTHLNVTLQWDAEFSDLQADGHTRHHSAIRFSASCPDALIFVVSADGPVTVFHCGEPVASVE